MNDHAATPPDFASHSDMEAAIAARVTGFSHLMRQHQFRVGLAETQDALRVADQFMCTDFPAFQTGLRSLMCCSRDQLELFDRLFEGYWCPADATRKIDPANRRTAEIAESQAHGMDLSLGIDERLDPEETGHTTSGASDLEVLRRTDFSQLTPGDQALLERLARRLWRRMALNLNRRLQGARRKSVLHFRRTMRRNLSRGGELVELVYRGFKPRKPRLVVLLDVSGSMELYSFVFLRLLHALHWGYGRVSSFVFSTTLEDITKPLNARTLSDTLRAISRLKLGWNGGTRIGESLHQLLSLHGSRVLRTDSVFIILSDGLDVGDPERLSEALAQIRRRTRRVIWLNPLLGREGYEPLARGMAAALPLVDVFAPAHNLESLLDIERYLVKELIS